MKTLRICLSDDLPIISERDPNYIYFLYDKLVIYDGQTQHYDQFCIVEHLPEYEEIIPSMWYICFDGVLRSKYDYEIHELATIEDQSQLELLYKAGTTFFYAAEKRHLNPNTGIIELPYLNGTFMLSVHLANNIVLDKDTVIAFNPITCEFEIAGTPSEYDDIIFNHDFVGVDTNTVSTKIEDNRIKSKVKLSSGYGNIIQETPGGLYASTADRVNYNAFDRYREDFDQYKEQLDFFVDDLKEEIERAQEIISEDAVTRRILVLLEAKYPGIEEALANYDEWARKFIGMEDRIKKYTDDSFDEAEAGLRTMIDEAMADIWNGVGDEGHIDPPGPAPYPIPDSRIVIVDSVEQLPDLGSSTKIYLVRYPKTTQSDREPYVYDMYYWKWTSVNPAEYSEGEYVFFKKIQEYLEFFDYRGPIVVNELPENPGFGATYMVYKPVEYEGDVEHYDIYTWLGGEDYVAIGSFRPMDTPHHESKSTDVVVERKEDLINIPGFEYGSYTVQGEDSTSIYIWVPGTVINSTVVEVDRVESLPVEGAEHISYTVDDGNTVKIHEWKEGTDTTSTVVVASDKSEFPRMGEEFVSYIAEKEGYSEYYVYQDIHESKSTETIVTDPAELPEEGTDYESYVVLSGGKEKHYAWAEGEVISSTEFVTDDVDNLPEEGNLFTSYSVIDPETGSTSLYAWEEV